MPNFRITLGENLPANPPVTLTVRYTYTNGATQSWQVQPIGADTDTAVVNVQCAVDLINVPNVASRVLIADYPQPLTLEIAIMSVMGMGAAEGSSQSSPAVGDTPYSVVINMSQQTVDDLNQGNFYLYGFKAVQTTSNGTPAIWFQTQAFGLQTEVQWTESYQAYTSTQDYYKLVQITASNAYGADLGQTLNVDNTQGTGEMLGTGTAGAISINNATSTQFTCGLSQLQGTSFAPICAFPLYGNGLDLIIPIEKVFLTFATQAMNTGTVIETAFSQGVFIDLTSENQRVVTFDMNQGWSWQGGGSWAQQVSASTSLTNLLVENSPSLMRRQVRGR